MPFLNCFRFSEKSPRSSYETGHFQVVKNEVMRGKFGNYRVKKFLNQGTFGQVAHCIKLGTKADLVVKIVRNDMACAGRRETNMLRELKKLNQDKNNLVRYIENFKHKGHTCLVFEKLDIDLHNFMKSRGFKPLSLSVIRVITQQMLVALNALKSIGLAHADMKADNIMMINHQKQPFKVKLIDFGLATKLSELVQGRQMQAIGYRAPEVILGLPLSEAVDMWSLGCIMAYLCLGRHLYPRDSEYENLRIILQLQGQPNDDVLDSGILTSKYFIKDPDSLSPSWTLKTKEQYTFTAKCKITRYRGRSRKFTSLNDVVQAQPVQQGAAANKDMRAFLSLLKQMLHVDPTKRITPIRALGHRFITMRHLPRDTHSNPYVKSAHSIIENSHLERLSVKTEASVTSSEVISPTASTPTSDNSDLVTAKPSKTFMTRIRLFFLRLMPGSFVRAGDAEEKQNVTARVGVG